MKSIHGYLVTRLLGSSAICLAVVGSVFYFLATRALERQFDESLAARVRAFASILFQVEERVQFEFSGELMPEYERADDPDYFWLWFDDGRPIERSESADSDLVLPEPARTEPHWWSGPLPDGRDGRLVAQLVEIHHVYPEEGPDRPLAARVIIAVGVDRSELLASRRRLLVSCCTAGGVLLGLFALLTWRAVDKGLAPARRLADYMNALRVHDLPQRVDVGAVPRELAPVVATTEALVQRVAVALERERRTVGDIAHELRTPISEILAVADVALHEAGDAGPARSALGAVRVVAWRMARAVSTLLELVRLEQGEGRLQHQHVELASIVEQVVRTHASTARERDITLRVAVDSKAALTSDAEAVRIVIGNLVANAVAYAPLGSAVEIAARQEPTGWSLGVLNAAPDMLSEDLEHLAQPFWRKDGARSDRSHLGLGLALSRALASSVGLQLAFELHDGVFDATLSAA